MREILEVEIFDTVARDGAQALPQDNQFPPGSKVALAQRIVPLGVNTIEAGFPATAGDSEEVVEVAATVGRTEYSVSPKTIEDGELITLPTRLWTPVISGLTRARPEEIETTWKAVQGARNPGIHVFVATSEEHMRAKHSGMTQTQILEMGMEAIRYARQIGGPATRVEFSCEATSTSNMDTLERFVRSALQEDVDVINLPDTLGAASPIRMGHIFEQATKWIIMEGREDEVMISSHNHDDGERAVQNAIASMHAVINMAHRLQAGIPRFQFEGVAAPRLGERNGNAFLAPFVRNILTDRNEFGAEIDIAVDTTKLKAVAEFICALARITIDRNTPVVGPATAEHYSGVHSDAILKGGAATYAAVNPMWFGHPHAAVLEDGVYQGVAGRNRLGATDEYRSELVRTSSDILESIQAIGMMVDEEQLERITVRVNSMARKMKIPVADTEIESFVADETGETLVDTVELKDFDEKTAQNTARVSILTPDGIKMGEAQRTSGNIGALVHAANNALGFDGDYRNWRGHSLEEGSDAIGAISLAVRQNGHEVTAFAQSANVDEASLRAYIKAINLIHRIDARRSAARPV